MNKLASIAFAVALSMGSLNLARADQPGPDWMPAQQVIEQVLKSGYTQVTKLKAEDGRWEGEGIKNCEFQVISDLFSNHNILPLTSCGLGP